MALFFPQMMPSYWMIIFMIVLFIFYSLMSFSSSTFFPLTSKKELSKISIDSWLK